MLLNNNFIGLTKLGLGRADFALVRLVLTKSQTLAKHKQLNFLRQCSLYNIFPPATHNIRLPTIFQSTSEMVCVKQKQRTFYPQRT